MRRGQGEEKGAPRDSGGPRWGPEKGAHGRKREGAREGGVRRAGWGPECCISGGGAKLRSWPFPSRSRREGGGPSGRILSVACPGCPLQSPGAFQPRILWPRTGPDARQGSRTITCLRQRGPSGHRSVSLAPITGTWTWSQAPPALKAEGCDRSGGTTLKKAQPRPPTLGLSLPVQGRRDGSDSAVCLPPAILPTCAE